MIASNLQSNSTLLSVNHINLSVALLPMTVTGIADYVNTPSPIREYRVCHCHRWRFEDCPNSQVAVWVRERLQVLRLIETVAEQSESIS